MMKKRIRTKKKKTLTGQGEAKHGSEEGAMEK